MGKRFDAHRDRKIARTSLTDQMDAVLQERRAALDKFKAAREMREKMKRVTIAELREAHPNDPVLNAALDEIARAAAAIQIDVSRWNILKIFGIDTADETVCPIITDPIKIEALVREKSRRPAAEHSVPAEIDALELSEALIQSIADVFSQAAQSRVSKDINTLRMNRDYYIQNINAFVETTWQNFSELAKTETQLMAAEKRLVPTDEIKTRARETVKTLTAAGFWTDFRTEERGSIWARTSMPVVLSERNVAAGIDRHVNLGYFALKLSPLYGQALVFPCGGNKGQDRKGFCVSHPHLWSQGRMCFGGDEAERFQQAIQQHSIVKMMVAVQAALSGYGNGGDGAAPYVPLFELENAPSYADQVKAGRALWETPYNDITATMTPKEQDAAALAADLQQAAALPKVEAAPEFNYAMFDQIDEEIPLDFIDGERPL